MHWVIKHMGSLNNPFVSKRTRDLKRSCRCGCYTRMLLWTILLTGVELPKIPTEFTVTKKIVSPEKAWPRLLER